MNIKLIKLHIENNRIKRKKLLNKIGIENMITTLILIFILGALLLQLYLFGVL